MKTAPRILALVLASSFAAASIQTASAADILVKCVKSANRSKISVDGGALAPGDYRARVISGDNRATSAVGTLVGDQVEFDFDSNPNDVAAGATKIGAQFIQNATVTAKIINAAGRTVISDTEQCRVR